MERVDDFSRWLLHVLSPPRTQRIGVGVAARTLPSAWGVERDHDQSRTQVLVRKLEESFHCAVTVSTHKHEIHAAIVT